MLTKEKFNILFYTTIRPDPSNGGIEHATITTANILKKHGHSVYLIYRGRLGSANLFFDDECSVELEKAEYQISDFVQKKRIDVIIIQSAFPMVKVFKKAIRDYPCKIITAYHFAPIWDRNFVNYKGVRSAYVYNKSARNFFRLIGYPVIKLRHLVYCYYSFRQGYRYSDRIVLLSEYHTSDFLRYVGGNDKEKITVIPNAIPSDLPSYSFQPSNKENILLIVARLDEGAKRISMALDLWREIRTHEIAKEWTLIIVGDGDAKKMYESYIKKHNLNVQLEGRQVPWNYYRRASIFMMTSRSEGWGITLLEAQKYGVVPVCFNTFAAASDVIKDKCTGFLIQEGDKQGYIQAVLALMSDVGLRGKMAQAGIEYVQRFSQDLVGDKWNNLVYSVLDK